MENPLRPWPAIIEKIKPETADTRTYTIAPEDGAGRDYRWRPGQFNMIGLFGIGEAPISISSDPGQKRSFDHTIRAVGDVTNALARLEPGGAVWIRGPYGRGWPTEEAKGNPLLIIAGGIGLAPLRPVVLEVLRRRRDYGRVEIVYGARTPEDLLYQDEFESWRGQADARLLLTVDKVGPGQAWEENVGVVTHLLPKVALPLRDCVVFVCGPEVMMRFTVGALLQARVNPRQIYVSLERRMKCGIAMCGHCQIGPKYVCKDGPVFHYPELRGLFGVNV
jgi:NAD(P)H-flavin reductase